METGIYPRHNKSSTYPKSRKQPSSTDFLIVFILNGHLTTVFNQRRSLCSKHVKPSCHILKVSVSGLGHVIQWLSIVTVYHIFLFVYCFVQKSCTQLAFQIVLHLLFHCPFRLLCGTCFSPCQLLCSEIYLLFSFGLQWRKVLLAIIPHLIFFINPAIFRLSKIRSR